MKSTSPVSFSVIIPNYNHAAFLPEALDSVVTQSHPAEDIYVIDDASTDQSVEIIRSYVQRYPRVHLIRKEKNCGVIANINEFLPQVRSTYVFLLAADDYLCPGCFERAHALLSQHPNAGFCAADISDLSPDGTRKRCSYGLSAAPAYFSPDRVPKVIRGRGIVGQGFFATEPLRQMGGFPESLRWHTDHFVCWVLAARHGLGYVPEVGGVFRKLPTAYSAQGMQGKGHQEVLANSLDYLHRPDLADVKASLRDGHALAVFDEGLFSLLWRNPRNRYFLTPSFVARLVLRSIRRRIRHPVPPQLKQWFRRKKK